MKKIIICTGILLGMLAFGSQMSYGQTSGSEPQSKAEQIDRALRDAAPIARCSYEQLKEEYQLGKVRIVFVNGQGTAFDVPKVQKWSGLTMLVISTFKSKNDKS